MQFTMLNQNIFIFLLFIIAFLFPFKEKINIKDFKTFPIHFGCITIVLSYLITNFTVDEGHRHTPIMLYYIILNYGTLIIFWYIYNKAPQQTTRLFLKTSFTFGIILSLYCIFEGITQNNPYIELMNKLNLYDTKFYDEVRFGIKRTQGFFSIYTTVAGIALNLLTFALVYIRIKNNLYSKMLIILFGILLLFSGMRSTILCMGICFFSVIKWKDFKPKHLIPILVVFITTLYFFEDYFSALIESFIHTDAVNGSTEDLRRTQFEVATIGLNKSPIYGNGIGYVFTDLIYIYPELAGADSIWINYMVELGFIGVISRLIFFGACLKYTYKLNKKLSFYVIGVILSQTIASTTSLPINFVFINMLILNSLIQTELHKHSISSKNIDKSKIKVIQ